MGKQTHVVVICGPAGSGKSTIAKSLASDLAYVYIEGDNYHTEDAVQRMSDGLPLTEAYRWDWLIRLRDTARTALDDNAVGVVLSCSALKRKHRDVIRILALRSPGVFTSFVYLKVSSDALLLRVRTRKDHYMKEDMVDSQLASLEEPDIAEADVMTVDASDTIVSVCGMVKSEVMERICLLE
ncbi:thermoresistant gluconokinase family protein [Ilyonectria destructans]|nr:thermoresistant gluconokinase family protein [Ilyonectria destructans]